MAHRQYIPKDLIESQNDFYNRFGYKTIEEEQGERVTLIRKGAIIAVTVLSILGMMFILFLIAR